MKDWKKKHLEKLERLMDVTLDNVKDYPTPKEQKNMIFVYGVMADKYMAFRNYDEDIPRNM